MLMHKQKISFTPKHNTQGIARLILIILILATIIYQQSSLDTLWLKLLLSMFIGFILSGIINLTHECLHQKFTGYKFFNAWVGRIAASLLLINFTVFKWHHLLHHRYIGTAEDTENHADFASLSQYLIALLGLQLAKKKISSNLAVLGKRYPYYINTQEHKAAAYNDSLIVIVFIAFLSILTLLYPKNLLFVYWLPLLFAYSGIMFFAIPEHNDCKPINGYYSLARSVYTNGLVRFFMWNGNFHAEHHVHPGASAYSLKDICQQESNYIWYRETSYLKWHYQLLKKLVMQQIAAKNKYG